MTRLSVGPLRRARVWPTVFGVAALIAILDAPSHAGSSVRDATATCDPETTAAERVSSSGVAFQVVGCGPPVVVLHGFSADRRMWDELTVSWRQRFQLVLIDLKSHGRSAPVSAAYDPAGDVLEVVNELRIGRFAFVGHSAGAAAAVDVALREPGRVAALVLLSPSVTGFRPSVVPDMRAVVQRVRAGDPHGAAEAWLANPVMSVRLPRLKTEQFQAMIRANWRVWQPNSGAAPAVGDPAASRLAAIRPPILLAYGEEDQSGTLEVASAIERARPEAEVIAFPHLGHWFPLEAPDAVSALAERFLARYAVRDGWSPRQ